MNLPPIDRSELEEALAALCLTARHAAKKGVSGGCFGARLLANKEPREVTWEAKGKKHIRKVGLHDVREDWTQSIAQLAFDLRSTPESHTLHQLLSDVFLKQEHFQSASTNILMAIATSALTAKRSEAQTTAFILREIGAYALDKSANATIQGELYGLYLQVPLRVRTKHVSIHIYPKHLQPDTWRIETVRSEKPDNEQPSAVFQIRSNIDHASAPDTIVHRFLAALRLFRPEAISIKNCCLKVNRLWYFQGGRTWSFEDREFLESALLSSKEVRMLANHLRVVMDALPATFDNYHVEHPDTTRIAYDHLVKSVFEDWIFEQTVMFSVMGLEALFNNDNHELSFKVSTRVGLAIGLLTGDSLRARNLMKEAYAVRSAYAHGALYNQKHLLKLTPPVGSATDFQRTIRDYLRISILIGILQTQNKKTFLTLLDDALLTPEKREALKGLRPFKNYRHLCLPAPALPGHPSSAVAPDNFPPSSQFEQEGSEVEAQ